MVQVSSGGTHTLVLTRSGKVYAYGRGEAPVRHHSEPLGLVLAGSGEAWQVEGQGLGLRLMIGACMAGWLALCCRGVRPAGHGRQQGLPGAQAGRGAQ